MISKGKFEISNRKNHFDSLHDKKVLQISLFISICSNFVILLKFSDRNLLLEVT